ncbi:TIGR02391 family protein [Candidatus Bathyarchaeota archaeon]|nr:MAG: TIGR02391 family protein [Candidatus Bathyarchaeota archaeon]
MGYSKNQLKRMFLKVLHEIQYGKMKGHSRGTDSIVPAWMNKHFKIKMTPEDVQLTHEAIQELKTSGLIVKDATQPGDAFQVLTTKGKEIVEKQRDPDIYGLQLEQVIRNTKLLSKCSDIFNNDEYETAIFSVYKLVEEEVRNKAGLDPSDFGVLLMTKALHPDKGKLIIPSCVVPQEQEGVYNLFKGAIAFFKNPSSHRTVNFGDRLITIKIIALAELLLQILSTAQIRT